MSDRRNLKSRGSLWAQAAAQSVAKTSISANQISILSIVMSIFAMLAFWYSPAYPSLLLAAAFFIQMRLLCNLLDGMLAVEYKKASCLGALYNELPDRFADAIIILGLSFAVREMSYAIDIGWLAVFFAIMTAYIRVLGRSLGTMSYFNGPMAKPQRMFIATLGALLQYLFFFLDIHFSMLYSALCLIMAGSIATCCYRLHKIANEIKSKHAEPTD